MTDRWFRFYDSVVDDPKVQHLPDAAFRAWVNLMCVASKNGGYFSTDLKDISFALRVTQSKARDLLQVLQSANLIERFETEWVPHNWSTRQYASDSSAERMRRHRAAKVTVDVTSHVQKSDAVDTDSEQNRTEQNRDEEEDARDLLTRICTILRVDLKANPERITWFRQVQEMLRDGLDSARIIAATEIARTHGKLNLSYIRSVAFNPQKTQQKPDAIASDALGERLKAKWATEAASEQI